MTIRWPFVAPAHKRTRLSILLILMTATTLTTLYHAYNPSSSLMSLSLANIRPARSGLIHRSEHEVVEHLARNKTEEAGRVKDLAQALEEVGWDADHEERDWTLESLNRLASCLATDSCGPGEESIVVLGSFHFHMARVGGVSGEDIWAQSTMHSLHILNHTQLYLPHHPAVLLAHQHIGHLIKVILWEGEELRGCFAGSEIESDAPDAEGGSEGRRSLREKEQEVMAVSLNSTLVDEPEQETISKGCIATKAFPMGVPAWKGFAFHWWGDASSPLGGTWTLSPERYGDFGNGKNNYLGYSIEPSCSLRTLVPTSDRIHRATVLGKIFNQLIPPYMAFPGLLGPAAESILPVDPPSSSNPAASDVDVDDGTTKEESAIEKSERRGQFYYASSANTPPAQVEAYEKEFNATVSDEGLPEGKMYSVRPKDKDEWFVELGKSKVLLGLGWPELSPSPYDALCMGVPFINVVKEWSFFDLWDRESWHTQHDALKYIPEPYIYHVHEHDAVGLKRVLQAAIDHPIDRFIVPEMTVEAVTDRHRMLVETDWEEVAWEVWGDQAETEQIDWLW